MTDHAAAFRPGGGRARAATLIFRGSMIVSVLAAAALLWQAMLWGRIGDGTPVSQEVAELSDRLAQLVAIGQVAFFVGTAISFLMWFHRARANLPALGITDARWSPGWAVGWWFIPVMFLFRPYQVASEIWRASDPTATAADWRQRPLAPLLGWWWAFFVASAVAGQISFRLSMRVDADTSAQFMQGLALLDVVSALIDFVGAWLAIRVVAEIDRRQTERSRLAVFT